VQAEAIINGKLGECYDLPINPTPSVISNYATRLSSALLLIRGYGTGSRDTSRDGYALYQQLLGLGEISGEGKYNLQVGEIGMICEPHYQLLQDDGSVIPRNDTNKIGDIGYSSGGRIKGRLYDITEEDFRYKEWQVDANKSQPGSHRNF
jgi:hypothetical protein